MGSPLDFLGKVQVGIRLTSRVRFFQGFESPTLEAAEGGNVTGAPCMFIWKLQVLRVWVAVAHPHHTYQEWHVFSWTFWCVCVLRGISMDDFFLAEMDDL